MRTNRFANPSFEVSTTGLLSGSDTATVSRTQFAPSVLVGGWSASWVLAAAPSAFTYLGQEIAGAVTPGEWVAASIPVRRSGGTGWYRMRLVFLNGSTQVSASAFGDMVSSASTYAYPVVSAQVPAGANRAIAYVYTYSSAAGAAPPAGASTHADAWRSAVAPTQADALAALTPYFDGDTPATVDWTYAWTGAPHASASTEVPTPGLRVERLPDAGAPQAGITVTGLAPSSESVISVQVSWDDGRLWHGVRGAERVTVTGGEFFRDHVPPLNVAAHYRLVVHTGALTPLRLEDSIAIESDSAWIQDPLNPRSAVQVECMRTGAGLILMTGTAARILRRQAVDLTTVEGARYPVASIGVRQVPSGVPLALRAVAASQGALINATRDLLDSSGQVVIRGLPTDIPLDAVAHVISGDIEEVPVVGGLLGFRNDWVLTVTQVRPTSMRIVVPWWTYDQVRALWAPRTYDQVRAIRPGATYLDWSRDPEVP